MSQDWLAIVKDLAVTAFGVGLGILGGLWGDRRISERRKKEDETHLLTAIRLNLQHNMELMDQLKNMLSARARIVTPTYRLDLSPWQTYSGRLDSIKDIELLKKITSTYYELEHLDRKVNAQFELHYGPLRQWPDQYATERQLLVDAILTQIGEPLSGLMKDTLVLINDELSKRDTSR